MIIYESLFANKIDSSKPTKHQHRKAQKEKKQCRKHNNQPQNVQLLIIFLVCIIIFLSLL